MSAKDYECEFRCVRVGTDDEDTEGRDAVVYMRGEEPDGSPNDCAAVMSSIEMRQFAAFLVRRADVLDAHRPPAPSVPSVRVRIAVAVAPSGEWGAHGTSEGSHAVDNMANASAIVRRQCYPRPSVLGLHYAEVTVPLPEEPKAIEGSVCE